MVDIVKQISMSLSLHYILRRNTYYEEGLKRIFTIRINHSRFGGVRGLDRPCNNLHQVLELCYLIKQPSQHRQIPQPKFEPCWLKEEGVGLEEEMR